MAGHALAFADALGLTQVDVLGFSLGGMVAQQIALERPSLVRRMLPVGTAPEGSEDIMHLEKPELKRILDDPNLQGLQRLVKLFFTPSASVAQAQIAAFRAWERVDGDRFGKLRKITQPFHESFVRQALRFLDSEVLSLTRLHKSRSPARPKSLPGFDSEGARASVPEFPRCHAGFCREKQTPKQTQGEDAILGTTCSGGQPHAPSAAPARTARFTPAPSRRACTPQPSPTRPTPADSGTVVTRAYL